MLPSLNKLSIRSKLTLAAMLACGGAILVACAAFAVHDLLDARRSMVDQMGAEAAIIAGNSTAALSFVDQNDAAGTLAGLKAEPGMQVAALFTSDGKALATYLRDPSARTLLPIRPSQDGARFGSGFLEVYYPVQLDGRRVGTVYLRSDLQRLEARVKRYFWILLAVFIGAKAVAWLLVWRLQRFISTPILRLAETARALSVRKDFSLRAPKTSDDELGTLTDAFNEMLAQLQVRDEALQSHRDRLEELVSRRTEQLVQANRHLAEQKHRAEQANRAKSAFLANMSHEIRTPMTAILGYADNMLEPDQTLSDRQDALRIIRRNARHLLELLNDILDISKIEADKMTVETMVADLPALISDVVSLMRPRAMEKVLSFDLEVRCAVPSKIRTDPLRLRQVLINLLGNAVKFTRKGGVRLTVGLEQKDGANVMRFDVADSGIGIAPEQMMRLFQPFSQADDSMTRRFGGTGLGLAISKRLAFLLGGDVTAQSDPDRGSTFTLTVNVGDLRGAQMIEGLTEAMLPRPEGLPIASRQILSARILLVEDGIDNQRLISMHLRKAGAEVSVAENGRIGVDAVLGAEAAGKAFDLVLMDMQMPELDGYGATSELRRKGQTLPVVALTAHAMAEDRGKCLAAGCTDYLSKPVEKGLLLRTIARYLPEGALAEPTPATADLAQAELAPAGRLRSIYRDDPDMAVVLEKFVSELPAHVQSLSTMLRERDLEELRRTVHRLKGSGGGYGFDAITDSAASAEKTIRSTDSLDQITDAVHQLIDLVRHVEGYDPGKETAQSTQC